MRESRQVAFENLQHDDTEAQLDLVVPFTTPALTLAALEAASRLGQGLDTTVRLLKIQVVPYPLEPAQSPVPLEFLREQLRTTAADFPAGCDVRLAREFDQGLKDALTIRSIVVIARLKRPWRTRNERIAVGLRRAGYTVLLVERSASHNA